ncbi:MAG TPA: hypothetical protein VIX80_00660 [Candidatus Kapabacteria bacterium]
MSFAYKSFFILVLGAVLCSTDVVAQPIVDTVKALQKKNDGLYRQLSSMEDNGESYTFTNVIKWKLVDPELQSKLRDALELEPFSMKRSDVNISEYYIFAAPASDDRVEPFHILLKGRPIEKGKKKKGGGGLGGLGGGEEEEDTQELLLYPFKGKNVIKLFRKNKALLDDVNTIQGDNVEIPGEIIPTGTQLIKNVQMRYAMSRMFEGFYSKKVILDAQRSLYGLPTADEQFQEYVFAGETGQTIGLEDSSGAVVDSILLGGSGPLPEDVPLFEKMGRHERTFDVSVEHIRVNATSNYAFELALGNPEVGLPFWTSGMGNFSLIMRNMIGTESNFKLGLVYPVSVFGEDFGKYDEFLWNKRNISGGWGATVSAYFAGLDFFNAFNLPVALNVTFVPGGADSNKSIIYNGEETTIYALDGTPVTLAAGKTFYRTSLIAQIYIPTILQLDLNSFLNVSVGFGIDNVQQSYIPTKNDVDPQRNPHPTFTADQQGKTQDLRRVSVPFNPLVNIQYVNHRSAKFGVGAAFDHLFTFSGWIELINDRLRIETSYSSPIIRDPKPWEPDGFFQITPRFYF